MRGALIGSVLVAALGGLLFGFDTAVISGTTKWLNQEFVLGMTGQVRGFLPGLCAPFSGETLANFLLGFTVASALIGTIIGSIAVGRPADTLGRRAVLIILAVFYFVSALGSAWAWDGWSFSLFRWLGGLAVGGASVVSPMYIAEISPAKYRGRLVAITQFNIVFGILLAYLSNYVIAGLHIGATECRWMYGVEAVPAAAFFFLLFFTPQSPRWLVAQGRIAEARGVLERCGADRGTLDQELQDIQASLDLAHHTLEFRFMLPQALDGAAWQLRDLDATAVGIVTRDGQLCCETPSGPVSMGPLEYRHEYGIRVVADIAAKTADVYVDGDRTAKAVPFVRPVTSIDEVLVKTGDASQGDMFLPLVSVSKGYAVCETFVAGGVGRRRGPHAEREGYLYFGPVPWAPTARRSRAGRSSFNRAPDEPASVPGRNNPRPRLAVLAA